MKEQTDNARRRSRAATWLDRCGLWVIGIKHCLCPLPKNFGKAFNVFLGWSTWLVHHDPVHLRNVLRLHASNLTLKAQIFFYKCLIVQVRLSGWLALFVPRRWLFHWFLIAHNRGCGRSNDPSSPTPGQGGAK